ncbi:MAG: D-alanine--D-alanine ligase [Gammaproteobacteria bacterium]
MTAGMTTAQRQEALELAACAGKVVVLMGGHSAEREVSLRSGAAILDALRTIGCDATGIDWRNDHLEALLAKRPDRVFIALHGRGGEDGCLQGALEIAGIPYTGSGVLGCALSMDKVRSKRIWRAAGLPTPDFLVADDCAGTDEILSRLQLPVMVKPAREGSSIGISLVEAAGAIPEALALARRYDSNVLIETFITGSEYTLSIVDGTALPLIKLETPRRFYDYEAKYHATTTRYLCPAGLPPDLETVITEFGQAAFAALDARGWGRVDLMVDMDGRPWLIELNAVPGMTDHSLVPMAARQAGWPFEYLVARILKSSLGERS